MITLKSTRYFFILLLTASFSLSMYGMNMNEEEEESINPVDMFENDEDFKFWDKILEDSNTDTILSNIFAGLLKDRKILLAKGACEGLSLVISPLLKKLEATYIKLPVSGRKLLKEAVMVLRECVQKSELKNKDDIIKTFKPLVDLINKNSDAGIIKQFGLLDLSGKIIVATGLPLGVYGLYQLWKNYVQKDSSEESFA